MATKPITLYNGTAGLNTVLDPQRLSQGGRDNPGIIELAQAVNVSIDDRGLVTLRNGHESLQSGVYHSIFCDGGDCFVVHERTDDAAIMRIVSLEPVVLEGVRSGLTKGLKVDWAQVNTDTFYSNGAQNGFIRDGSSSPWPVGEYTGPDADMQFAASAPIATHMAFRQGGQCILADGPAVYINHAPFQYGLFSLRKGYIGFESDVAMLCPALSGFFASDGRRTWFFRKQPESWYGFQQELVEDAPAVEWSLAHDKVMLRDIGIDSPGFGRIWASARGICLGTDDGTLINLTEERIGYPKAYNYGACLIKGTVVLNTLK